MNEGWGTCPRCGKRYYAEEVTYPQTDMGHDIGCPNCDATIGHVGKGTKDFNVVLEEDLKKRQEQEAAIPNCPKCGAKMVLRKGYSKFWGCSRFPDCNGTRSYYNNNSCDDNDDDDNNGEWY